MNTTTVKKGFIQDFLGNRLLPITRAELILDKNANMAFRSGEFAAIPSTNGEGGLYGLMSPSDKEILATLSESTTIDIDNKLKAINEGLKVGEQPLHFYRTHPDTNAFYKRQWTITTDDSIAIDVDSDNSTLTFKIGTLSNGHIPSPLENKQLINATVLSEIPAKGTNENRGSLVASVGYVDTQFENALGIAAGGLQFKGTLSWANFESTDKADIDRVLNSILANNINGFYIWNGESVLQIDGAFTESGSQATVGRGDILIVAAGASSSGNLFVHVPSGNEITGLEIIPQDENGDIPSTPIAQGVAQLSFNNVFTIEKDGNRIDINLPKADGNHSGYLSAQDYREFRQAFTNSLTITANESLSNMPGSYVIATIEPGTPNDTSDDKTLYGKDTTYQMTGDTTGIKFGYTNPNSEDLFTIKPGVGIAFTQEQENPSVVQIKNNLRVLTAPDGTPKDDTNDSTAYLTIEGDSIQANIGNVKDFNNPVNGLASVELVHYMLTNFTTHWITIDHDLTKPKDNPAEDNLYYGTDELQEAIKFKNTNM